MSKAEKKAPSNKPGKSKKKKWGSSKVKEKLKNATVIDQKMYDKIMNDVPGMLLVSTATLSEKFKISGAIARKAMKELVTRELIVQIGDYHASNPLYRGTKKKEKTEEEKKPHQEKGKKGKKGKKKEKKEKKEEAEEKKDE